MVALTCTLLALLSMQASALVTLPFQAEDSIGFAASRVHWRSNANNARVVWLHDDGDNFTIIFCLPHDMQVTVKEIRFSSDGWEKVGAVLADEAEVGTFLTAVNTDYGNSWNLFQTAGPFPTLTLGEGRHTLNILMKSSMAWDPWGMEIDQISVQFEADVSLGDLSCSQAKKISSPTSVVSNGRGLPPTAPGASGVSRETTVASSPPPALLDCAGNECRNRSDSITDHSTFPAITAFAFLSEGSADGAAELSEGITSVTHESSPAKRSVAGVGKTTSVREASISYEAVTSEGLVIDANTFNASIQKTPVAEQTTLSERNRPAVYEASSPEGQTTVEIETSMPEGKAFDLSETSAPEAKATDVTQVSTPEEKETDVFEISTPKGRVTDVTETSTPEARLTDVSETSKPEAKATDISETKATDVSQTRVTDITERSTPERKAANVTKTSTPEAKATDVTETSTPEAKRTGVTETITPKGRSIEVSETTTPEQKSTDVSVTTIPEAKVTDVIQISRLEEKTTDISEATTPEGKATDESETRTPDAKMTDVIETSKPEGRATDVTETSTPKGIASDVSETSTLEGNATNVTELSMPERKETYVIETRTPEGKKSDLYEPSTPEERTSVLNTAITPEDNSPYAYKSTTDKNPSVQHDTSTPVEKTFAAHDTSTPVEKAFAAHDTSTPAEKIFAAHDTSTPAEKTFAAHDTNTPAEKIFAAHDTSTPAEKTFAAHDTSTPAEKTFAAHDTNTPEEKTFVAYDTSTPAEKTYVAYDTSTPGGKPSVAYETTKPEGKTSVLYNLSTPGEKTSVAFDASTAFVFETASTEQPTTFASGLSPFEVKTVGEDTTTASRGTNNISSTERIVKGLQMTTPSGETRGTGGTIPVEKKTPESHKSTISEVEASDLFKENLPDGKTAAVYETETTSSEWKTTAFHEMSVSERINQTEYDGMTSERKSPLLTLTTSSQESPFVSLTTSTQGSQHREWETTFPQANYSADMETQGETTPVVTFNQGKATPIVSITKAPLGKTNATDSGATNLPDSTTSSPSARPTPVLIAVVTCRGAGCAKNSTFTPIQPTPSETEGTNTSRILKTISSPSPFNSTASSGVRLEQPDGERATAVPNKDMRGYESSTAIDQISLFGLSNITTVNSETVSNTTDFQPYVYINYTTLRLEEASSQALSMTVPSETEMSFFSTSGSDEQTSAKYADVSDAHSVVNSSSAPVSQSVFTTHTSNTVSGSDTAHTSNTVSGSDTAHTSNTVSGSDTAHTSNTVSGSDTAHTSNTVSGSDTTHTSNTVGPEIIPGLVITIASAAPQPSSETTKFIPGTPSETTKVIPGTPSETTKVIPGTPSDTTKVIPGTPAFSMLASSLSTSDISETGTEIGAAVPVSTLFAVSQSASDATNASNAVTAEVTPGAPAITAFAAPQSPPGCTKVQCEGDISQGFTQPAATFVSMPAQTKAGLEDTTHKTASTTSLPLSSDARITHVSRNALPISGQTALMQASGEDVKSISVSWTTLPWPFDSNTEPTLSQSTPTLSHSTPALSQSTPTLSKSTPTLSQSTPTLSQRTSSLSQSTPTLSQSTPTLSQSTPTSSQSTSSLSHSTPTLRQMTPSSNETIPSLSQSTPSLSQSTPTLSQSITPNLSRSALASSQSTPTSSQSTTTLSQNITPTLSQSIPTSSQSTPNLSQSRPTSSQSTPSFSQSITPTLNQSKPTLSQRITSTSSQSTASFSQSTPSLKQSTPTSVSTLTASAKEPGHVDGFPAMHVSQTPSVTTPGTRTANESFTLSCSIPEAAVIVKNVSLCCKGNYRFDVHVSQVTNLYLSVHNPPSLPQCFRRRADPLRKTLATAGNVRPRKERTVCQTMAGAVRTLPDAMTFSSFRQLNPLLPAWVDPRSVSSLLMKLNLTPFAAKFKGINAFIFTVTTSCSAADTPLSVQVRNLDTSSFVIKRRSVICYDDGYLALTIPASVLAMEIQLNFSVDGPSFLLNGLSLEVEYDSASSNEAVSVSDGTAAFAPWVGKKDKRRVLSDASGVRLEAVQTPGARTMLVRRSGAGGGSAAEVRASRLIFSGVSAGSYYPRVVFEQSSRCFFFPQRDPSQQTSFILGPRDLDQDGVDGDVDEVDVNDQGEGSFLINLTSAEHGRRSLVVGVTSTMTTIVISEMESRPGLQFSRYPLCSFLLPCSAFELGAQTVVKTDGTQDVIAGGPWRQVTGKSVNFSRSFQCGAFV